jgi:hypothetical protein
MLALKQNNTALFAQSSSFRKVHTTLYDLVEAVSDVIEPGEKRFLTTVVKQLINDYNARFESHGGNGRSKAKGTNTHMYLCWRAS